MIDFLMFIAGVAVGWLIGLCVGFLWKRTVVNGLLFSIVVLMRELNIDHKDLDRLLEKAYDQRDLDQLEIRIESHSGQLYAYTKDTNEFLAQGADKETLMAKLTQLNLGITLIIDDEDGADLVK
jgi:hypothetical protein